MPSRRAPNKRAAGAASQTNSATKELVEYSRIRKCPADPPKIAAQVHQTRWFRIAPLAAFGFSPTPQTIASLTLPNAAVGWSGFRIRKIRVYAPDSDVTGVGESYAVQAGATGIVSTGVGSSFIVGDGQKFQDSGTKGQRRAGLEIVPSFEFRNKWWSVADTLSVPFEASTVPLAAAASQELFLVDLLLDTVSST